MEFSLKRGVTLVRQAAAETELQGASITLPVKHPFNALLSVSAKHTYLAVNTQILCLPI